MENVLNIRAEKMKGCLRGILKSFEVDIKEWEEKNIRNNWCWIIKSDYTEIKKREQ